MSIEESFLHHRIEETRVMWISKDKTRVIPINSVISGSVSWNSNANLHLSGSIKIADTLPTFMYQGYIKVSKVINDTELLLGTYMISAPKVDYQEAFPTSEIKLIDKLDLLASDILTESFALTAGTPILEAIIKLMTSKGITELSYTPSDKTLKNDLVWKAGTSLLKVINELLSVLGYWGLFTDLNGNFMLQPYTDLASRVPVMTFTEGDLALHTSDWSYELDYWKATNKVVLTSQENKETQQVYTSVAEDRNPESPTSIVNIGRVLNPIIKENIEVDSQDALDKQAQQMLQRNSNVKGAISIKHALVPLFIRDVVAFNTPVLSGKCVVEKMSIPLEVGALVSANWKQV